MKAAVLAVALAACQYEGQFPCTQSEQCRIGDSAGTCEQAGWCSVHDDVCDSGRRFDVTAGDNLAGTCVPGPAGCVGWTSHLFKPCGLSPPSGNLTLDALYGYDTTTGTLTDLVTMAKIPQPSTVVDGVRYLSVQDVTLSAAAVLRVTGDKPLVIAAWGSMSIVGTIDAGSHANVSGAGADPTDLCGPAASGNGSDVTSSSLGGGGGGGGFQGAGGAGGISGTAGKAVTEPPTIRGGCPGGRSGKAGTTAVSPATAATSAPGGHGGGGLVLSARLALTIDGVINVGGEGGDGSPMGAGCGGGGGGSGGMLVLEGSPVELHGTAQAAGGGGGGVALRSGAGGKGKDATVTGAAGAAGGTNCTTTGGAGSTPTSLAGSGGGSGLCGGAGGGGGSGWILVVTDNFDQVGAMVSPAPSIYPI